MSHASDATAVVPMAKPDLPDAYDPTGDRAAQFINELADRMAICQRIANSGMTRHRKPEQVLTIMYAAHEMGIPFMQALGGMYSIDGKIGLEGQLMLGLAISRCDVRLEEKERSKQAYRAVLKRPGWDPLEIEYTIQDAIDAGLVQSVKDDGTVIPAPKKYNWKHHTKDMLQWRAISAGLRRIAPDYFASVYSVDEINEIRATVVEGEAVEAVAELEELRSGRAEAFPEASMDQIEALSDLLRECVKRGLIDEDESNELDAAMSRGDGEAVVAGLKDLQARIDEANADQDETFLPSEGDCDELREALQACEEKDLLKPGERSYAEGLITAGDGQAVRNLTEDLNGRLNPQGELV